MVMTYHNYWTLDFKEDHGIGEPIISLLVPTQFLSYSIIIYPNPFKTLEIFFRVIGPGTFLHIKILKKILKV